MSSETVFTYVAVPDDNLPVHLLMAGITSPGYSRRTFRLREESFFVFQYIKSGSGYLRENAQTERYCQAGDILINHAGCEQFYYPDKADPWGKVWINVSGKLVQDLLDAYGLGYNCIFSANQQAGELLERSVLALKHIPREKADDFTLHLILQLISFIRQNQVNNTASTLDSVDARAEKLRKYLTGFLMKVPPTMGEISEYMELSPAQVMRIFRNAYNTTPYAWLLDAKLQAAADNLRMSSEPVRMIAERFAFTNEYYFSRIFRQKMHQPPGEYRNSFEHKKV